MNKKQKKELKRNIENEEYIDQNNELIFKKLVFNPLFRGLCMCILLVFSLINRSRIIRLAALTSNAVFGNEYILGHVTYFVVLGVTIGGCFIISLIALIIKSNLDFSSILVLRRAYHFYSVYDMVVFVCSTFVCLFFIIMILITPCNISGSSMENTFQDNDRVFLWNIGYHPKNGDVVVFDSSPYTNQSNLSTKESRFYIKRVIAKEGDVLTYTLSGYRNPLLVNGEEVEQITAMEYWNITGHAASATSTSYTIPENKVLVMGDNRPVSVDSRSLGLIDEEDIIGKVLFRFYPFNRIGNPVPSIV